MLEHVPSICLDRAAMRLQGRIDRRRVGVERRRGASGTGLVAGTERLAERLRVAGKARDRADQRLGARALIAVCVGGIERVKQRKRLVAKVRGSGLGVVCGARRRSGRTQKRADQHGAQCAPPPGRHPRCRPMHPPEHRRLVPPRPVYEIPGDDRIAIAGGLRRPNWQGIASELDRAATSPSRDISSIPGLEAEYRALRLGAGIRLCAERVVIRMSGDDRATFLHGMCSNDINGLEPGGLVPVLFLTERAHLIGDANVWSTADALLLETDRALWPAVRAHLERFLVADDVELEASDEAAGFGSTIQIDGPKAVAMLAPAFDELTSPPAAWRFAPAAGGVLVAQVTRWGAPAFTILAP